MTAYYNEIDPFAAAWLRELIKEGVIDDGEVDERDMWDVIPSDLMGFSQIHLCAGIGGWSYALRLAEWPDDQPVLTVSLPCQPFSAAGQGKGLTDERGQLAEAFFWLAGICLPNIVFGEQVEVSIRHDWWDVMASQMETIGYTVGEIGFPSSSVGSPHIRQRLYFVAHSNSYFNRLEAYSYENMLCKKKNSKFSDVCSFKEWSEPCPIGAQPMEVGDGISNTVGKLRGYGNAIVPQAAAEFIKAFKVIHDQ